MKTKPEPSWYRYCISRRSTLAVSTLVSALKVRSTTLPESTCLSLVRTTVLPLPGLWCWNHKTDHNWPSKSNTMPFFRSFVDATLCVLPSCPGQPPSLDPTAIPPVRNESSHELLALYAGCKRRRATGRGVHVRSRQRRQGHTE